MKLCSSFLCILAITLSMIESSPLYACDEASKGASALPTANPNQQIEQILHKYSRLGIHDLAGLDVLTFATKKSALGAILTSGTISPVSKLSGVAPTIENSNRDVVYTMLQPRWLVKPEEHENKYVSKQVIFCLPTQLIVDRTDWFMNILWAHGKYAPQFGSAHSANSLKLEEIISYHFNQLYEMIRNVPGEAQPWLNNDIFKNLMFRKIINEVLFKSDIDLTSFEFEVCLYSEHDAKEFLDNNQSLSHIWDFKQQNNCLKVKRKSPIKS